MRLHELQVSRGPQRLADAGHVPAKHGGEVRIHCGRVTTGYCLDLACHLMAQTDVREAHFPRHFSHETLMLRVGIAVQKDDGKRPDTARVDLLQLRAQPVQVGPLADCAVGKHSLVHFDHFRQQRFGLLYLQGEYVRSVLIADPEQVGKATRHDEAHGHAPAFQQGICGDGGAHSDGADAPARDGARPRRKPQEFPHGLQAGVVVAPRVVAEEFADMEPTARVPRHHVRERAAPINPEIPAFPWCHPPLRERRRPRGADSTTPDEDRKAGRGVYADRNLTHRRTSVVMGPVHSMTSAELRGESTRH